MEIKYDLGVRTRAAYQDEDKKALKELIKDYTKVEKALAAFYEAFKTLWFTENKPHGFDVQDIRLGGLMQRIRSCKARIKDYLAGKLDKIDELEEELLEYQNRDFDGTLCLNTWLYNATANIL